MGSPRTTIAAALVLGALLAGAPSAQAATPPTPDTRSYILDRGVYEQIAAPGGSVTIAHGISNRGELVGAVGDVGGAFHGFLRDRHGRYTTIDVPGASQTGPTAINNRRQIVGAYGDKPPLGHAFVWERGRFTTIDDPDADITSAFGINELGDVVGATANVDAAGNLTALHGFVRNPRGRVTPIDDPGALGTAASAIDNRGRVVGFSYDAANVAHGFLASRGRFRAIDAPGGTFTQLASIDDRGQIVVSSDAVPPADCVSSMTGPSASSTAARTRVPCAAGPATTAPRDRR